MAAAKKTIPSKTTAVANWDQEMADAAAASAKMEEGATGGQFISVKGGVMTMNDAPVKGNQLGVVIFDSVLENVFYPGEYDPDTPQSPTCFAFGRDEKQLAPHKLVIENGTSEAGASGLCAGCPQNEFGTAARGKGKACRNTRRLGMAAAGQFNDKGQFELFDDAATLEAVSTVFMKLPVTSVKGYANFVKQISETLKRPPWGIVTRVSVTPDAKSQFKVNFEPIMNLPNDFLAVAKARSVSTASLIEFPYRFDDEEAPPPPKRGGAQRPVAKKAVGKGAARRY